MRDEVGLWPHVRGAVGISTRGRDTGDAQIFIDLVDNPRLDHDYTVFAQVLNGMDIVDAILEGDVIERIEILVVPDQARVAARSHRGRCFRTAIEFDLRPNRLAQAVAARRTAGHPIIDLTESNPTRAGLRLPGRSARAAGRSRARCVYEPAAVRLDRGAPAPWPRDYARQGIAGRPRADRADGEHQRGVLAALQAAGRRRRRGAGAAPELSAVRVT